MTAKTLVRRSRDFLADLFSDEEDPNEPGFDPVHLGTAIMATFSAMGAIFWLLWTLLVYEGGIFLKVSAAAQVLLTDRTAADFGWVGYPYEMGAFEGTLGNCGALVLTCAAVWAVAHLYRRPWKPTRH